MSDYQLWNCVRCTFGTNHAGTWREHVAKGCDPVRALSHRQDVFWAGENERVAVIQHALDLLAMGEVDDAVRVLECVAKEKDS